MDIINLSATEAEKLAEFINSHKGEKIKIWRNNGLGGIRHIEVSSNDGNFTKIC